MIKETIVVEIKNIKVGKKYYSFEWRLKRNGKIKEIIYGNEVAQWHKRDSSHSRAPATIRRYLKTGGAVETVLGNEFY